MTGYVRGGFDGSSGYCGTSLVTLWVSRTAEIKLNSKKSQLVTVKPTTWRVTTESLNAGIPDYRLGSKASA